MKVLFLANTGWYLDNFRRSTIIKFQNEGFNVLAVCPEGSGEGRLSDLQCSVSTFQLDGSSTNLILESKSLIQIYRILSREKPDLIFSFNPKTNLYGLICCRLLRIPCVANVSGVGNASQLSGWKATLYRQISKFAYRSASHIFFQNDSDCEEFERLGIAMPGRYQKLPGSGVDLNRYLPVSKGKEQPFIFLMACRLIRQKGVVEYLKAAEELVLRHGNCEFWLAGVPDTSLRAVPEKLIADAAEREVIRFLGNVKEMEKVMAGVDCVVLPSWYPEGVPRILLEGAASGKVLISTNRPGCRDVIDDGSNGYFVEAQSVDSLILAMERVISLEREKLEKMKHVSRRLAEDVFDEQYVISRYLEITRRVLRISDFTVPNQTAAEEGA